MRTLRLIVSSLLLVVFHAVSADAQTPREMVTDQLNVIAATKADEGFVPDQGALGRATLLGVLEDDATVHIEVILDAARNAHIAARCDTGCANVDTRVLNPDYSLLVEDTLDNDAPRMELKPTVSGPHLLAVRMASCAAQICYFGVIVLSRPVRR